MLDTSRPLSIRLYQKNKKLKYQKSLLTLDVGWLDKRLIARVRWRVTPDYIACREFSHDVDIIAQSRKHKKFFCQDKTMCGLENKCQAC